MKCCKNDKDKEEIGFSLPEHVPSVLSDNDSDDTVDTLASVAEQPKETLSQEMSDKKKRRAKQLMCTEKENNLINWISQMPCHYQKEQHEYRDTQKRSHLWAQKAAQVEMTELFFKSTNALLTLATLLFVPAINVPPDKHENSCSTGANPTADPTTLGSAAKVGTKIHRKGRKNLGQFHLSKRI